MQRSRPEEGGMWRAMSPKRDWSEQSTARGPTVDELWVWRPAAFIKER